MAGDYGVSSIYELHDDAEDDKPGNARHRVIDKALARFRNEGKQLFGGSAGNEVEIGRNDGLIAGEDFDVVRNREDGHHGSENSRCDPEAIYYENNR